MNKQQYESAITNAILKPQGHSLLGIDIRIEKRLWTLTTVFHSNHDRCIGVYDNFADANEAVLNNYGDMFEFQYGLAVVEAIEPNRVYGSIFNEAYWYVWVGDPNVDGSGYRAIETPIDWVNVVGWGVG